MPSFDIVSEINLHEVTNAVDQASRDLREKLSAMGTDPFPGKPEEFPAYIRQDQALWEKDIRRLNIQLEE